MFKDACITVFLQIQAHSNKSARRVDLSNFIVPDKSIKFSTNSPNRHKAEPLRMPLQSLNLNTVTPVVVYNKDGSVCKPLGRKKGSKNKIPN